MDYFEAGKHFAQEDCTSLEEVKRLRRLERHAALEFKRKRYNKLERFSMGTIAAYTDYLIGGNNE